MSSYDSELKNENEKENMDAFSIPREIPDHLAQAQTGNPPPAIAPIYAPTHQEVWHTGTVDSLIAQNDDLMARLAVSMRRAALLEQKLLQGEGEGETLRKQVLSLSDQVMIYREKDRTLRARLQSIDTNKDQAALYRATQQQLDEQLAINQKTGWQNRLLTNYRRRVQKYVQPLITRLSEDNRQLTEKCLALKEERAQLQNRMVSLERSCEVVKKQAQQEVRDLQESIVQLRHLAKDIQTENQSLRENTQTFNEKNRTLSDENIRYKDQVDGLQNLWNENRKKLDEANAQREALKGINQELSAKAKDLRLQIQELRENHQRELKQAVLRATATENSNTPTVSPQIVERLEGLLVEIQKGMNNGTPFTPSLNAHNFIDQTGENPTTKQTLLSEQGDLSP